MVQFTKSLHPLSLRLLENTYAVLWVRIQTVAKEGSNRVKKQSSKNRKPKNNIELKLLFRLKGLVVCAPTYDAVDGFMLWKYSQFSISALMQPSVLCI